MYVRARSCENNSDEHSFFSTGYVVVVVGDGGKSLSAESSCIQNRYSKESLLFLSIRSPTSLYRDGGTSSESFFFVWKNYAEVSFFCHRYSRRRRSWPRCVLLPASDLRVKGVGGLAVGQKTGLEWKRKNTIIIQLHV